MERELVQDTRTTLTGLCIRIAGHRMCTAAVGELEHVGAVLVLVDQTLAEIHRADLKDRGELFAVFQEEPRLDLVSAGDPAIQRSSFAPRLPDSPVRRAPRPPDLA